ncbi:MAG: LytTR family DNA-binding domain-containing protein [Candidatus Krumholzibacteria bacterium]|nr:LytTR family DNA-binding domain-containing protein [Candidatus Krumholzibacteria bacterium]
MSEKERLRVLIVDDESPARRDLKRLCSKIEGVEIVGEGSEGLEAVKLIKKLEPDVVLLDIQMPGLDGFQVVSRISGLERAPAIVFVTAYDSYAIKAFEVHAVDYVLKPVEEKRLSQAIERSRRIRRGAEPGPDLKALISAVGASPRRLAVRQGESLVMVDVNDILYATVSEGAINVVARALEGTVGFRSLDELEKELGTPNLVRVHKSYLANINRIYEITPWFNGSYRLRMEGKGGPVIPLSRAQARELRKILKW